MLIIITTYEKTKHLKGKFKVAEVFFQKLWEKNSFVPRVGDCFGSDEHKIVSVVDIQYITDRGEILIWVDEKK